MAGMTRVERLSTGYWGIVDWTSLVLAQFEDHDEAVAEALRINRARIDLAAEAEEDS